MATVKDITTMCKNGQVLNAYKLAQKDLAKLPEDLWRQRALGWALYYIVKQDVEKNDYINLLEHLTELNTLQKLIGCPVLCTNFSSLP